MIVSLPVRVSHCDPAGIAYFPRLFELVDAAVEEWTAAAVGVARAEMHGPLRLGLPTVDLHATFAAPCRLGETLEIAVAHGEVGGASVVLTATVTVAAAPRFAVTLKQVLMDLDTPRPVAWPPERSEEHASDLQSLMRISYA